MALPSGHRPVDTSAGAGVVRFAPHPVGGRLLGLLFGVIGLGSIAWLGWLVVAGGEAGWPTQLFLVAVAVGSVRLYLTGAAQLLAHREALVLGEEVIEYTAPDGRTKHWPTRSIEVAHLYTVIVGRFPQPALALRDHDGAVVADLPLAWCRRTDALEARFLAIGVRVTREPGVVPVGATDRRPGVPAAQVIAPTRLVHFALLVGAALVPVVPAVLGFALGAPDGLVAALLLVATIGPVIGMVFVVRRTYAITVSAEAVRLGAGHRASPPIPRAAIEALEVEGRPLGSVVRIRLRDGRAVHQPLLGVPAGRVRREVQVAGLVLR